jgi:HD-like signal output (HDOD) protein
MSTNPTDGTPETPSGEPGNEGSPRGSNSALSIMLPPDGAVWSEARRLAADKSIRVEDLAICCAQDPVMVLELLRVSNAMFFAGGKSPITSAKTAIVRLGSDVVIDTLDKMKGRAALTDDETAFWFESHRSRCRRTSIVARILGEALSRTLADDCNTAGLMLYVGEMLAVAHFGERYVQLADQLSKSGLNYRLAQDYRFDVEKMGVSYLRKNGMPEALLFAIDREGRSRSQDRVILKPLCWAAGELVEAFDSNRWEKLAPGKSLPPKSSLRMLQIPDNQYLKIYERCSEYLFAARLQEERRKLGDSTPQEASQISESSQLSTEESPVSADALQDDIQNLLRGTFSPPEEKTEEDDFSPDPLPAAPAPAKQTPVMPSPSKPGSEEEAFGLAPSGASVSRPARGPAAKSKPKAPELVTARGKEVMQSMTNLLEAAKTGEELLSQLLEMLVESGTFEKSALIVVSKDRKRAKVVAARGPNIGNGQTIIIDDPLSPLAQCFTKVKSWGNKASKDSPWGSSAFAVAPIDAAHETPVALYADCGANGALTFEARRIFRTVVEVLNKKLPEVPGGIPVEL